METCLITRKSGMLKLCAECGIDRTCKFCGRMEVDTGDLDPSGLCPSCARVKASALADPAPAPSPNKIHEEETMKETTNCACGKTATVRKKFDRPAQCDDCYAGWKTGQTSAPTVAKTTSTKAREWTKVKPGPMNAPAAVLSPRVVAPLAEVDDDSRSMTQQMMGLTGRFLTVISEPEFPLDNKVAILCDLSEGVKNLSKVALIRAEQALK